MADSAEDAHLEQLRQTLNAEPANSAHHYNLGLYLWKKAGELPEDSVESKRCNEAAAESFLSAAKLNPGDGAAFRLLGHYYATRDAARAAKCYQRAVMLDPDDADAGEGLCDLLDSEGKESLEVAVCKEAAEKSPRAFWAYQRLGYLMVYQRKWSKAIQSLQHAIRGYPTSPDLWEALGLAYQRMGMLTAAVKSYGRAAELEDTRIYALIESGNIHIMLGSFSQGVENFRSALQVAPNNLSARFGLSSALLAWARSCVISGAYSWAASLLEEASKAASDCTLLSGNQSSVWKLLGDIKMAYARCLPWNDVKIELNGQVFTDSILEWKRACLLAAHGAKLSYQKALHLAPWQANLYADAAISLDVIYSLEDSALHDSSNWHLSEKMFLGGLMLEPSNKEFWVSLGCLSRDHALKQHSLIRGLQLDLSFSKAWADLGKLYRSLGDKELARLAFDRARSIDPSSALPWAGMSADIMPDISSMDTFESCLRAVQIFPLAEFQVGLGMIARHSGNLQSPQVLAAIRQAVRRAPDYPEVHNVNGLVYEARSDYQSAVSSFRKARYALQGLINSVKSIRSHLADVAFNLARSLCKAGFNSDAVNECESLKAEGLLGLDGLQLYAFAMYKLGKYSETLVLVRDLAQHISSMGLTAGTAGVGLIVSLVYNISGKDPAAVVIQKFPNQLLHSARLQLIIYALHALGPSKQVKLPSLPSAAIASIDLITEPHRIIALGKILQISTGTTIDRLRFSEAISYLKKVLHMYPHSCIIRNELNYLLLCDGVWMAHNFVSCNVPYNQPVKSYGLKLPEQVQGAVAFACYCSVDPSLSFLNCVDRHLHKRWRLTLLQRWVHREPWNKEARYLLAINLLQKSRAESYPLHLCTLLKRLISQYLAGCCNLDYDNRLNAHMEFSLQLSQSEINLQSGDIRSSIDCAKEALKIDQLSVDTIFAHLQLSRLYALQEDFGNSRNECIKCTEMKTTSEIVWVMLKYLGFINHFEDISDIVEMKFRSCVESKGSNYEKWAGLFSLACAQCYIWDRDYSSAEQVLSQACEVGNGDSCLMLLHGAICMELARQLEAPQFISRAAGSFRKAQRNSCSPLPIVPLLLARAEGSLGSKAKWERNLRLEWSCWPQEARPPELYFQMHLLAKQTSSSSGQNGGVESSRSPGKWLVQAIHLDPSCSRYWRALYELMSG